MKSLQFGQRWFFRNNLENTLEFSEKMAENMTNSGYQAEVLVEQGKEGRDLFIVNTRTDHTPRSFETNEYISAVSGMRTIAGSNSAFKETGHNDEYNVQIMDIFGDFIATLKKFPGLHADKVIPDKLHWDA